MCTALKYKPKNIVIIKKEGRNGKCYQCDKVEHFDCVNANSFVIESIQKGHSNYYCTECLTSNPVLGLEVLIEGENSIDEQMSITTEKSMEPREEAEQTVFEIVDDIIVEQIPAQIQESEGWKCDECPYETKMK